MSIPARSSGRWPARPGPKVDERDPRPAGDVEDLAGRYEAVRAVALADGPSRAGLAAALLMSKGMAAWMWGWRACTPAPPGAVASGAGPPGEVVGVLAAMALACTQER